MNKSCWQIVMRHSDRASAQTESKTNCHDWHGHSGHRRRSAASSVFAPVRRALCVALASALGGLTTAHADGLPSGATVTVGSASFGGDAKTLVIDQTGARLAINWQSFGIAAGNGVVFHQPDASAIALNRVVGNEKSVIDGSLTANGQVFLVNSNGVLFGRGASVNTAGLVASTLDLSPADFAAGSRSFSGTSTASVSNAGSLAATDGGYVALIGASVANTGSITADRGMVALAAGRAITLRFEGDSLLGLNVDAGVLAALVDNGGAIQADGGRIVLTAGAADALLAGQVNTSGVIQARSLDDLRGSIALSAPGGAVALAGSLLATAATGDGGSIATTGKTVTVADAAVISTHADTGVTGNWTLGADSVVVGSGGTVSGATLGRLLASNNIALGATAGDLTLNDAVAWSADTALDLAASGAVAFAAPVSASGDAAGLSIDASGDYRIDMSKGAAITLGGAHATLAINGAPYTLIHNLDELAATVDPDQLTATGNYAIANDIDASGRTWSDSVLAGTLVGTLAGLGHTIAGLKISNDAGANVGLVQQIGWSVYDEPVSAVRDIALTKVDISSPLGSGGPLAGMNNGVISNAHASGVASGLSYVGGLVAMNGGSIINSSADVAVSGREDLGGLAGWLGMDGGITDSHASGAVTVTSDTSGGSAGGLVGLGGGYITDSYATGAVTATGTHPTTPITFIGGLVGIAYGNITRSWASGAVTVTNGNEVGGLVGSIGDLFLPGVAILSSYATGDVTVHWNLPMNGGGVGGLAGRNEGAGIFDSYATGDVTVVSSLAGYGFDRVGGLVGDNVSGYFSLAVIDGSHASGNVFASGGAGSVGGLVGLNWGENTIKNSSASGNVTGDVDVGGLVGSNIGILSNVSASGNVVNGGFGDVGGLVGLNSGTIDHGTATGLVQLGNGLYGGLTGGTAADSNITNSSYHNDVAEAAKRAAAESAVRKAALDARAVDATGTGQRQLDDAQQNATRSPSGLDPQGPVLRIPRLDANLLFASERGYSPSVRRIEINGQVFEIDDDETSPTKPR